MWIVPPSIRSAFSRESGCLTKDCTPDLDLWASEAERSCTLNGKPTRSQSWKQGCKKAPYLMRLSGLAICANLTQSSFQAWWIASLRASRAKTSALQADALGLMASAAVCSLKSPALPVIAVRDTSFWRTSQASLLPPPPLWTKPKGLLTNAQPPASWENWPTSGGMRNGQLFQRPTLEPATGGRGGFAGHGGWASPKASDGQHGGPNMRGSKGELPLPSQAAKWDTPDCNTSTYSNGKMGPNIREQAATWPTPRTTDTNQGRGSVLIGSAYYRPSKALSAGELVGQANLADVAQMWPTPNAHVIEHKSKPPIVDGTRQPSDPQISTADFAVHVFSHQAQQTQPGQASSSSGPTSPRRLNPAFTEWLMGWPTGWTIAAPSASSAAATALWRHRLHLHLSALCAE